MWARLKQHRVELRSFIAGWLVVTLLVPILLGFVPQAQLSQAEAMLRDVSAALCDQAGMPAPAKGSPHQHDQDCPCCLPGGPASVQPMLHAAAPEVPAPARRSAAFVAIDWLAPRITPQDRRIAPSRGPPALLA
ncbi:MAG: hypothetical protein KGO53_00350 [Alphaproteobacteria bacterium]|nr:hypothetical protein [Alphaproteobacteria bacterium]